MPRSTCLTLGSEVLFEGQWSTVTGFDGPTVRLRSPDGRTVVLLTGELVSAVGFKVSDSQAEDGAGGDFASALTIADGLPDNLRARANAILADLLEARTGYRSGRPEQAAPGEPRPAYDPATTSTTTRMGAKAAELGVATSTLYLRWSSYEAAGLVGLLDKRLLQPSRRFDDIDERVIATVRAVFDAQTDKSTITKEHYRLLVQARLDADHGKGSVACPPRSTFNKLFDELTRGRGAFGASKARRSIAERPGTPYRRFQVTRPGEVVVLDSTPLDAFALDPVQCRWVPLELTLAQDLYSRSIVGWRFTPMTSQAVDIATLLMDVLSPKPMRPGWPEESAWRYHGVPETLLIQAGLAASAKPLAGIPAVRPETLLYDRGKVFVSEAVRDACAHLGISIQLARPQKPTDKPHLERTFRTVRESFVALLPGYKGPDVHSRGRDVEADAFYTVEEIEALFARWVATYWQRRPHDQLRLPCVPHRTLSPNEMYDEGIARAGFVFIPPDPNLYYALLPTAWRQIHHYGVDVGGLRYDGDGLDSFRNTTSPYKGRHAGTWPLRHDPRDLSRVFFQDPETKAWSALGWVGARDPRVPFTAEMIAYAKALVVEDGGRVRDRTAVDAELARLAECVHADRADGDRELRLARRSLLRMENAQHDSPRLAPVPDLEADDQGERDVFDVDPDLIDAMALLDEDAG